MVTITRLSRVAPLGAEINRIAERLRPSVVTVHSGRQGSGAGILWTDDTVITNHHVAGRNRLAVAFADGARAEGLVVARDPENDLAAIRIDGAAAAPATIGDSAAPRPGQVVIAIGHPIGVEHAVTVGIVNRLPASGDGRELLRANIVLNPGNSGGPLLNARGEVVGVNAMAAGPGVALAIPERVVRAFLRRSGPDAPYLGVETRVIELPRGRRDGGIRRSAFGLLITGIQAGSPAVEAGLLPGDVILALDGEPVASPLILRDRVALAQAGGELALTIMRAGVTLDLPVRPATRPVAARGSG